MSVLTYAALSDQGRVRDKNEDNWFARPELGVFGVADGMGGQNAGALASRIVVETLPSLLANEIEAIDDLASRAATDNILSAVAKLSKHMSRESENKPGLDNMGATVVAAIVRDRRALIIHMGDSRAYFWRNQRLERLTKDHSVVQYLVDNNAITPEQAVNHPARSQVTRYVGMDGKPLPKAQRCLDLQAGDWILLCTDGLTGMVDDERLATILSDHPNPQEASQSLIDAANASGGTDNITALIVSIEDNSEAR